MVRATADRAFLPVKNLLEQVGDMMILTGKTIMSALRPPYPYGGEFVNQFLLAPFFATLLTNASTTDLWGSVVKCTMFGAIVAIVCCYKGMTASGGAEGVGRAVNSAVVIATTGVFAFNYVFTQTLLATHPEISVIK